MTKIVIYTEPKFLVEKKYVFKVIFEEILGIQYDVFDTAVSEAYRLLLPDGRYIEFKDSFFSYIPESIGYLKSKYLPTQLIELKNVLPNEVVPVFYGSNIFTNHGQTINCGADIFGSAFFMLTRWEEIISDHKDKYGRFIEDEACAVKFGVIQKPLVHIYAELIRKLLTDFGLEIPQKHTFQKVLTHDVDFLYKWETKVDFLKNGLGDLFKRLSPKTFKETLQTHKENKDPYDTFDKIMTLSEQNGYTSLFYILLDKRNERLIPTERGQKILKSIQTRNHSVGIHSNYVKQSEKEKLSNDIHTLESMYDCKITKNRQHFLRLQIPETFHLLEDAGIEQDSSLYYSQHFGFRTGMCIEHSLFDCKTRKILLIKELPLTIMDRTLLKARNHNEAITMVDSLLETVKKYNGTFVCLWHNSSFNSREWKYLDGLYEHIVEVK